MKSLKLILKSKWYNLIADGIKHEEYRELKPYYINRLFGTKKGVPINEKIVNIDLLREGIEMGAFVPRFESVTFYRGYQKGRDEMTWPIESITIGKGKEEWGAEPGKEYFVIRLKNEK